MKRANKCPWTAGLVCLVAAAVWSTTARAEFQLGKVLKPADEVKKVTVTLNVGNDGDDLEEGVALDLGLGFPLLLEPVGRQPSEAVPFGAVPQQSTAGQKIAAGGSGQFTFALGADPGQDQLRTTDQLLAGIRVSDISRIGLASLGKKNWTLAGYEIRVNDELLASNDQVNKKAGDTQSNAQFGIAELGMTISPLEKTVADLEALAAAQLATEADLEQLAEAKQKLKPLAEKLKILRAQTEGRYPWFVEDQFVPFGQAGAPIKSARVTLLTRAHSGADTKNRVYFRTGGHKYLLSSYDHPLSSSLGPQVFELDLLSGPLTAGNVRGYAVGMLANDKPQGDAPDRWHPDRILVELEGSIVYDSDEYPYDRKSLDAIRIIPPAQLAEDGSPKSNENHTAREVYEWESGKAMGLDAMDNSPLPLPEQNDPAFPEAEPGLPDAEQGDVAPGEVQPEDEGFPEDDFFPGENNWFPDDGGAWIPGGGGGWPAPGGGGGWWPPIPGGGGGWWPPPGGWWPPPGGGANPPPAGPVPQVKDARITSGWRMNDPFTVEWDFQGDESTVSQYRITLYVFKPEANNPIQLLLNSKTEPVGVRSTTLNLPIPAGTDYIIAQVTADFNDGTVHADLSPAHAVFPANTDPLLDKLHIIPMQYQIQPVGPPLPPPLPTGPIVSGNDPGGARAVWTFGLEQSHIDFEFDGSAQAWNVALRPAMGDASLDFPLVVAVAVPPGPAKKARFVSYIGFAKGKGAVNTADFSVTCAITKLGGPAFMMGMAPLTVANPIAGVPQPMQRIDCPFDSSAYGGSGVYLLQFRAKVAGGLLDVDHPPAFFGARFVPEP
ncbi:MAG: hypothetical protein JW818_20210 [Pirellulales bacterium]|nr:hypothetical protein [Pirellulales bacterium]